MEEDKVKLILETLIRKIILPKARFLKLHAVLGPSESDTPHSANFYVLFILLKEVDYEELSQIKNEIRTLFKMIGVPEKDSHGTRYAIRTIFD